MSMLMGAFCLGALRMPAGASAHAGWIMRIYQEASG